MASQSSSDWFAQLLGAINSTIVAIAVGATAVISGGWAVIRGYSQFHALEARQVHIEDRQVAIEKRQDRSDETIARLIVDMAKETDITRLETKIDAHNAETMRAILS